MKKALFVVSYASWISQDFRSSLDPDTWDVIKNYGFDLPSKLGKYEKVVWWMNAQHAARVRRALPSAYFMSPGAKWLSGVPRSLTKRQIRTETLEEFWKAPPAFDRIWAKPAEAKIEDFPADWYSPDEVIALGDDLSLPAGSFVQWTDTKLDIDWEHRFYVLNGQVVTGSPYLVDGVTYWDGYEDPRYSSRFEEAEAFASRAVTVLGDNQPSAYTLDVGYDSTVGWLVIEGNPAWCSGVYGADPEKVIDVLERSCSDDGKPEFEWVPDAYLQRIADRKRLLR